MPEVTVRRRLGRRSGGLGYRARRWFHYRRATIAVWIAAAVAVGAAMAFWTLLASASFETDSAEAVAVAQ